MTEPFKHKSLRQYTCFDDNKQLVAGISTRQGGYSERPFDSLNMGLHVNDDEATVVRNRKQLADEIGFPLESWVIGEQVHGTGVHVVGQGDLGKGSLTHASAVHDVDGVITNRSDILLAAFYADCVPLFFCDVDSGWIGIAHAGWKGTVHGMASEMIRRLVEQGCSLDTIQMTIGPSIGSSHYEVDQHVIDHVPEPFRTDTVIPTGKQKYKLDLKKLNQQFAIESGLQYENIMRTNYCTYEEEDLFFSHRRDQGKSGRMLGYIGWKG